jgi:TonB family protein
VEDETQPVQEAVSQVLIDRAREADGLSRMVGVSLLAHTLLIAGVVVMPAAWRSAEVNLDDKPLMITLGGAPGPDAGGMTPISSRTVQTVEPEPPKIETRPAVKPPEMVAPNPVAKVVPKAAPKANDKPVEKSASRKPTAGAEVKTGDGMVNTGAQPIPFGGLSTGGGGDGQPMVDVANFCCPAYLLAMKQLIMKNWNKDQGATGLVQVRFVVQRDGTLTDISVEKPSNIPTLDLESQRALARTKMIQPLPREFTDPTLGVHLIFDYRR